MKKLTTICLIPLIISCVSTPKPVLPDYWEYSPGKYVAFKKTVELAWDYDESEIDKFEIDREKLKLKKKIKQIKSNPKVALCIRDVQIEGEAVNLGYFNEESNEIYREIFRRKLRAREFDALVFCLDKTI